MKSTVDVTLIEKVLDGFDAFQHFNSIILL